MMFAKDGISEAIGQCLAIAEGLDSEHCGGVAVMVERHDDYRVAGASILPGDEWEGRDGYLFVRQHRDDFERAVCIPYEKILAVECRSRPGRDTREA
jgi:hypothetical protein